MRAVVSAHYERVHIMSTENNTNDLKKRIVVIGGGFAGLNFMKHIDADRYDVTIVDRDNAADFLNADSPY